jgi:hypothetical protein
VRLRQLKSVTVVFQIDVRYCVVCHKIEDDAVISYND